MRPREPDIPTSSNPSCAVRCSTGLKRTPYIDAVIRRVRRSAEAYMAGLKPRPTRKQTTNFSCRAWALAPLCRLLDLLPSFAACQRAGEAGFGAGVRASVRTGGDGAQKLVVGWTRRSA